MSTAVQNLQEMMDTLREIKEMFPKKAAKAGVNAGLAELTKEMRRRVNSMPISAELKSALRKTIAKRLKKKERDDYTGKAGFGVGRGSKKKRMDARARHLLGQGNAGIIAGVGISANNVHWLMGTQERQTITGHRTGAMPDVIRGVIKEAAASAAPSMLNAAAQKVTQVLAAEAAKAKKG
jgi:hypothetical protein